MQKNLQAKVRGTQLGRKAARVDFNRLSLDQLDTQENAVSFFEYRERSPAPTVVASKGSSLQPGPITRLLRLIVRKN
jgi:hypothetical protein